MISGDQLRTLRNLARAVVTSDSEADDQHIGCAMLDLLTDAGEHVMADRLRYCCHLKTLKTCVLVEFLANGSSWQSVCEVSHNSRAF